MTSKKSERQKTFHENSFNINLSEKSNGLASTIKLVWSMKKQDKRYSTHKLPLHITEKTKHCSRDIRY